MNEVIKGNLKERLIFKRGYLANNLMCLNSIPVDFSNSTNFWSIGKVAEKRLRL